MPFAVVRRAVRHEAFRALAAGRAAVRVRGVGRRNEDADGEKNSSNNGFHLGLLTIQFVISMECTPMIKERIVAARHRH